MKKINNTIKFGLLVSIFSVASSYADDLNSLNQQKSNLRDATGILQLEAEKIAKENSKLQLEKENKLLKIEINQIDNNNGSYEIEKLYDPIFGDKLTKEDKLSFKSEKLYGVDKKESNVKEMNKKDTEKRAGGSEISDEKIDIKALEDRIRNFVKEEMNKTNQDKNIINNNDEGKVLLTTSLEKEEVNNITDINAETTLVDFSVKKLTIFGDKKSVKVGAIFEIKTNSKKEKTDEKEIYMEEGQIYTYYKKVYFVERITNKQVVIKNTTDNQSIVKHI